MIYEVMQKNDLKLYDYFNSFCINVPYYFPTAYGDWRKSMFNDCNYDGMPLFSQLHTFAIEDDGNINGFIQFGLSNFVFDSHGKIDTTQKYSMIRNLYYDKGTKDAHLLFDKAIDYFNEQCISKHYAFFHFFGMSCYARQGKLHESAFHMEEMLCEYGYEKEHENVYFTKSLHTPIAAVSSEISFLYSNDGNSIDFINENGKIGGCELYFVPNSSICFLKWIYIDKHYCHQGLGTKCMSKLFFELHKKGISRIDTDTIDSNMNAQNYYLKTGFENKGIMRSYHM